MNVSSRHDGHWYQSVQAWFAHQCTPSFPTASAVLSDVSALQYDYQYEYKKSNTETKPVYAEDFYLKIYLASKDIQALNEIPFYFLDEKFQSTGYNYQTGWVKFSDLSKYDFNNIEKLFFAVLPESFKDEEEFLKFKAENEVLVNEIA